MAAVKPPGEAHTGTWALPVTIMTILGMNLERGEFNFTQAERLYVCAWHMLPSP